MTILLIIASASCSATARPMPELAEEINATLRLDPMILREGDALQVRFLRKPDWNFSTRVRQDGRGSFTGLEELQVAGKTLREVSEILAREYAKTPERPEVTVDIASNAEDTTVNPRGIVVIGEVANPGPIMMRGERISLVEALARAGGHDKRTANLGNTLLVRWLPAEDRRISWRMDASVEYWGATNPVMVQPNDVIFVPNTAIDEVNIWVEQYIRLMLPFGMPIAIPAGN